MYRVFTLIAFFVSGIAFGQDLIVTRNGDSLNVLVTKQKKDYIYFITKKEGAPSSIQTLMPTANVRTVLKDFYSQAIVSPETRYLNEYTKIRIGFDGGFSWRLANSPDGLNNDEEAYFDDFKSGYTLGGDFTYFLNEMSGIGLQYNLFRSKANTVGTVIDEQGNQFPVVIADDVSINFFGAYYAMRFLSRDRMSAGILRFSAGYTAYRNDFTFGDPYTMTANCFGIGMDMGYDIGLTENLALGLGIGIITGYYENAEVEDFLGHIEKIEAEPGEGDNLARLNLTVGLRFLN